MEFCANCQQIKPYVVVEFYKRLIKNCRDCGFQLGFIELEEINTVLNELIFYKEEFYKREINNEKET